MTRLWSDIRYGARNIHKSPLFSVTVVSSLALDIGANTAIFTLLDSVFLRSLPVKDPARLVLCKWSAKKSLPGVVTSGYGGLEFSYPAFERFKNESAGFSEVFGFARLGFDSRNVAVSVHDETNAANAEMVTGAYFRGLGVQTTVGRTIDYDDNGTAPQPVAVISYAYWARQFATDPGVLGRVIYLNSQPYIIIGVSDRRFTGARPGQPVDIWVPLTDNPALRVWDSNPPAGQNLFTSRKWFWLTVIARLRPAVTTAQAEATLLRYFGPKRTRPMQHVSRLSRQTAASIRFPNGIQNRSPFLWE